MAEPTEFRIRPDRHDDACRRAAGWLASRGVGRGDRVAIVARNHPATLALAHGALRSAAVPVLVGEALPEGERSWILEDCRPSVVVDDPATVPFDEEAAVDVADIPLGRPMLYTSGTAGRRKGVWSGVLSEDLARAWAEDERELWAPRSGRPFLVCSPLSHSAGYRAATSALLAGADLVLLERFDPGAVVRLLADEPISGTFLVPTHLRRILAGERAELPPPRDMARVLHAGEPCPQHLKRRAMAWLGDDVPWEFYGSTEGQFTAISPAEWLERPDSVGRARPGRRLEIGEADRDGVGTVFVSAPAFARWEYWGDPEGTAAAWRGDLFTAGDLGRLDEEGFLSLVSRRGDLVISGGVNVYPAEVERVLLEHPAVHEAVVFGVPDEEWGERVTAVVAAPNVSATDLHAWARERLEPARRPKAIAVRDALPRTSTGKLDRTAARGLA